MFQNCYNSAKLSETGTVMRIVVNKKYKLIQVMGTLYRCISFTSV